MTLVQRLRVLCRNARQYPRLRDRLLSFYNLVLVSQKLRGLPLPGRQRVVEVRLCGREQPFCIRLGSTDWLVLTEIFFDDEYDAVRRCFEGSPPATILDLGANAGFSVRYWLECFPQAHVVAVEPEPENFALLTLNSSKVRSAYAPTLIQACAVGQPRTEVFMDLSSGREWAYAVANSPQEGSKRVTGKTIPEILSESGVRDSIDLLKCDIEGAEEDIFKHADGWLPRLRRAVVEVHHPFTVGQLLTLLASKAARVSAVPQAIDKSNLCVFQVHAN